jgi:hypothetical protein
MVNIVEVRIPAALRNNKKYPKKTAPFAALQQQRNNL